MLHSIVSMLHSIVFVLHCIVLRLHSIVFMLHSIVFMLYLCYIQLSLYYISLRCNATQWQCDAWWEIQLIELPALKRISWKRKRWRMCSHSWRETSDLTASTGSPGTAKSNLTVISYHDLISQKSPSLNLKSSLFNTWGVKLNIKSNCTVHVCNEFEHNPSCL